MSTPAAIRLETLPARRRWVAPAIVFAVVLVAQLVFVAVAGTDIPFHDQWDVEGRWLYPAWCDGSLSAADLLRPVNEHRIGWTHLLNLGLFAVNGQWDPLVQLGAIAILRAMCAAGLAWAVGARLGAAGRTAVAVAVSIAFLPHLAWHNALWGNQSQVLFALGWSLLMLGLLGTENRSVARTVAGLAAGGAALIAMAPAALAPLALIGLAGVRASARRQFDLRLWRETWPALALLLIAWLLRAEVPEHAVLRATTWTQFITAVAKVLAWPHGGTLLTALVMNVPVLFVVAARVVRRRATNQSEDFVLLIAGWCVTIAFATAWTRGGSDELSTGVPSRYVDFVVLLPLANAWCAVVLASEAVARWKAGARLLAGGWGAFLLVGWLGLSAEVMRGLVLPRMRDREAPARLARAFQMSDDASIFAGQPRLLVPHPNLESVRAVLVDPRMRGALPPSLQPEKPLGPLSRVVRAMLGRQ